MKSKTESVSEYGFSYCMVHDVTYIAGQQGPKCKWKYSQSSAKAKKITFLLYANFCKSKKLSAIKCPKCPAHFPTEYDACPSCRIPNKARK